MGAPSLPAPVSYTMRSQWKHKVNFDLPGIKAQ
jgi:hypothetical protein